MTLIKPFNPLKIAVWYGIYAEGQPLLNWMIWDCWKTCGFKSRVYVNKPHTLKAPIENIRQECENLSPEALARVLRNAIKRKKKSTKKKSTL